MKPRVQTSIAGIMALIPPDLSPGILLNVAGIEIKEQYFKEANMWAPMLMFGDWSRTIDAVLGRLPLTRNPPEISNTQ
jgi:hypothetical protein